MKYTVEGSNEFHDGWVAFLLGEEIPPDPAGAEGWRMGSETPSVVRMREVLSAMRRTGDLTVQSETP